MWSFRSKDFVYYDPKVKPIAKKPRPAQKISIKVGNHTQACGLHHPLVKNTARCLKQVDQPNIAAPSSEITTMKSTKRPTHYQASLMEMQKAVREQENMYRKYFRLGQQLLSYDAYNLSQEVSPINYESSGVKACSPANYFSQILEDPKDNDNILFLEHATEPSFEKEVERSQQVADCDVSAYFTV